MKIALIKILAYIGMLVIGFNYKEIIETIKNMIPTLKEFYKKDGSIKITVEIIYVFLVFSAIILAILE